MSFPSSFFFLRKGVFPPSYELWDVRLLTPFFVPTVCVHTPRQVGVAHTHTPFAFWRKNNEGVRWDEACSDRRHGTHIITNTEYRMQPKKKTKSKTTTTTKALLFFLS